MIAPGAFVPEALMIFGAITELDPRSLGQRERAAAELGLTPDQAVALQKVAKEVPTDGASLLTSAAIRLLLSTTPVNSLANLPRLAARGRSTMLPETPFA